MQPLPTLHRWGRVLVQHITSYCSAPSWQPYPSSRSCDSTDVPWSWLAYLLPIQWSDQAYLGILRVHFVRHRGQHIRSRWFSPLDGSDQEGGGCQHMDSPTRPGPSRHRGFHWHWAIPCLGGVRLSGDEHYSLHDQVCVIQPSDSYVSRFLIRLWPSCCTFRG